MTCKEWENGLKKMEEQKNRWNLKYFKVFSNGSQHPFAYEVMNKLKGNCVSRVYRIRTKGDSYRQDVDLGRYSNRCWYHKYEHNIHIHGCYRIVNKGRTLKISCDYVGTARIGRMQKNITLRSGWAWKEDEHGIFVTNGEADYHPTSSQLQRILLGEDLPNSLILLALSNHRMRLSTIIRSYNWFTHRHNF